MGNCTDRKFEPMIHAYELGTLADEERRAFELHLLDCESCFEAVRRFEETSRMLRTDPEVRNSVKEILDGEPSPGANPAESEASGDRRSFQRWVPVAVFAAAAVLLIVLKPWHIQIHPTDEVVASENRLAVMPFENLVEPEDTRQLGRIVASLLVSDLSESQYIDVVSSQHLMDIARLVTLNEKPAERAELVEKVSSKAGARWRLTGSILQETPNLILVWELTDTGSRRLLASERVTGKSDQDIFSLVDELTVEIKGSLPLPLSAVDEPDPRVAEVTTHSPEAYRYYLEGLDAYSRLYVSDARMSFLRAIEYDSTFAMAHFRLTLCLPVSQRSESIDRAVRYSEGISRREKLLIGALKASIDGDYSLYVDNLKAIAGDYPDEKEVFYWLGSHNYGVGEYQQAVDYLQRAVEIDPLYKDPYNVLAYAYAHAGDSVNSIKAINRYIELAPGEANPFDSRGDLYLLMGNTQLARESFMKAVEIRRDFADYSPLTKIGRLDLVEYRYEEARAIFQELAGAEADGVRACGRYMLAYIPVRQGEFEQALEILDNAVSADVMEHGREKSPINHLQKALIYQQTGQLDLALREIESCQRIYAEVYERTLTLYEHLHVQLLAQTGRLDSAKIMAEKARQALEQGDNNLQVYWLSMGAISLTENDPVAAVEYLERASESYAYSFAAHYWLGRAYLAAGRLDEAATTLSGLQSCYESGRTFWGTWDINSHYYLARVYEDRGETTEAINEYEIFLGHWQGADRDLVEVQDALERLTRLKSVG